MSLSDIRSGLATNLGTISSIRTYTEIPDNPVMPCAIIALESVEYDRTFGRGETEYTFTVRLIVARVTERRAQQKLDEFIDAGARSVKTAIESDRTLGGAAFDAVVERLNNIDAVTIGSTDYLAADFAVTVYAQ